MFAGSVLKSAGLQAVLDNADPLQPLCSRYMLHRSKWIKGFVVVYILFNTQVAFPRVLKGMADAAVCTTPFVLRYINAQPLLTSCLTTMVRPYQSPTPLRRHAVCLKYLEML